MQTSQPLNKSNQAYSNNSSQTSEQSATSNSSKRGPVSLEVINHFGADAPAVLNNYAVQVEDALINTNNQLQEALIIKGNVQEHKAYETILTDPDVLADYTCEFYGPNGPYPVEEDPAGQ